MKATVDRVGRIVIPKPVRDALGIRPDTELEVTVDNGAVRLEPTGHAPRRVEVVDGLPILRSEAGWSISDADVVRLRDADRR